MKISETLRRAVLSILLVLLVAFNARGQSPLKSTEYVPGSWTLVLLPDSNTVHVKSYSPLFDSYLEEPGQQFSFEMD